MMCNTGPKTSRSKSFKFGSSIAVGTINVPAFKSLLGKGSANWWTLWPLARIISICFSMFCCASRSITGPMSVLSKIGLPTLSCCIAPFSILTKVGALSSCTHSTRRAEQRCPALSKAEFTASMTTCSVNADESTIIAFWPPVSAINGIGCPVGLRRWATVFCKILATSVEPVNIMPWIRSSWLSLAPTVSPRPGKSCTTDLGTPTSQSISIACVAINGVCSAGLAMTVLPATKAAATCPVKIASGKFQGLIHKIVPSGFNSVVASIFFTCAA